jgi:hypothetical protein
MVLLVSLAALLLAAAAVAIHIYRRAKLRRKPAADTDPAIDPAEEADAEAEV